MNEDELGRLLADELHRRIDPPAVAPEPVQEHFRSLLSMRPVRLAGGRRPGHLVRDLFGLAAVVTIVAVVGAGLIMRPAQPPTSGFHAPKDGIEAFGRIDASTAWAESGSDLYITRDAGQTWSEGTVPGGKSLGQILTSGTGSAEAIPTATAVAFPQDSATPNNPDQSPLADQNPYSSLPNHFYPDFIDADHGWLLSWTVSGGVSSPASFIVTVWRTSDGGQSWQSVQLPGTYKGYGLVQFVDASHGWVTLFRLDYVYAAESSQTSGGDGNGAEPSPTPQSTLSVPSDTTTVLATVDGGTSWSLASTMAAMAIPHFISPTEAWGYGYSPADSAAGVNSVVHSTDGGRTWSTSLLPVPTDQRLVGWPSTPTGSNGSARIQFESESQNSPAADGSSGSLTILTIVSSDSGSTWKVDATRPVPVSGGVTVNSMATVLQPPADQPIVQADASSALADQPPGFRATFDGGATWTAYSSRGLPLSDVTLAEWTSPDDAWVMVSPSQGSPILGGQLYATHDRGQTWQALLGAPTWPALQQPVPTPIVAVTPPEPASQSGEPAQVAGSIEEIGRIDAKQGWALETDSSGVAFLRVTQDGGATWSEPRKAPPNAFQAQFVDASHGWALTQGFGPATGARSMSATVWRTSDGGASWQNSAVDVGPLSGDTSETFGSAQFHFRDSLHGELFVVYGPADAIGKAAASSSAAVICDRFSTSDGGATWSEPMAAPCLSGVTFPDASFGYATDALKSQGLYITTDGGQTWASGTLPSSADGSLGSLSPQSLERASDGTLRALINPGNPGQATAFVVSDDGGKTWTTAGTPEGFPSNSGLVVALGQGHWLAFDNSSGDPSGATAVWGSGDDGLTWAQLEAKGPAGAALAADFVSPTDGWALTAGDQCIASSSTPQPCMASSFTLSATSDGGATWTQILTQ
jgi:hypothetical protein